MVGKYECQLLLSGDPRQVMVDEYGRCNHEECRPELRPADIEAILWRFKSKVDSEVWYDLISAVCNIIK